MQIHEGKIESDITDAKLQELAIKTLVPQSGFPATLKQLLKPGLIQGIINAEAARWGVNDDMPSIPDVWGRALFAMALPVRGVVNKDPIGWIAATTAVGTAATTAFGTSAVAAKFGVAITLGVPAGWIALAGAGVALVLVEGLFFAIGAIAPNPNASVGRGQITQQTWDKAAQKYGAHFAGYLDQVMKTIDLKKQMQQNVETYQLNNISVKYNPMDKRNVKVLENFMIGAVLLLQVDRAAERMKEGRSAEDALKYGIAAYHGIDMNKVNTDLGKYGNIAFPSKAEFESLGTTRQDHYSYIEEVINYAH